MSGYYWKLKVKSFNPDQPRVPAGDPRGGQWTSQGNAGELAANTVVPDAPTALQGIINNAVLKPVDFTGRLAHAAGTAAQRRADGSYVIHVSSSRRPTKSIVIHEAAHGHQSKMDIEERDEWERRFSDAARVDNGTVPHPWWSDSMLDNGAEIWAEAAGTYYGGTPWHMEENSPNVLKVLRELYEQGNHA